MNVGELNAAAPRGLRDPGGRRRGPRMTRGSQMRRRKARLGLLLVAPSAAIATLFFFIPLGYMVYTSLYNWPLLGQRHFLGLANYATAFADSTFLHSLLFAAEYTAIVTPMIFVLGYGLAVLVRRQRRLVGLFRTMYFLPFVVGLATASYVFLLVLQPVSGVLDAILSALGISSVSWLSDPTAAVVIISIMVTWKTVGFTMILLMAGMQAVPSELYEAAEVDGAGWWMRERRITLPLLKRPMALALVISIIGSYLAFDQFFILTQGGPVNATVTPAIWIYETDFTYDKLGYGAALSVIVTAILVILSVVQIFFLRDSTEFA